MKRFLLALVAVVFLASIGVAQVKQVATDVQIMPILSPLSESAADDRSSEVIDTKGYHSVVVMVHLGAVDPNDPNNPSEAYLKSANVATNETTLSSGADVEDSSIAYDDDSDGVVLYWEFHPDKRYYQLVVNNEAATASNQSAVALLYNADKKPVTHAAGGTGAGTGSGAVSGVDLGIATQGTK